MYINNTIKTFKSLFFFHTTKFSIIPLFHRKLELAYENTTREKIKEKGIKTYCTWTEQYPITIQISFFFVYVLTLSVTTVLLIIRRERACVKKSR